MDEALLARARALCPVPVRSLTRAGAGGNSRIYRLDTADGPYALKAYPSRTQDPRDRLGVEFSALQFMHRHGITDVPRPIAADPTAGLGLYGWCDGQVVRAPDDTDADTAISFLERLHRLRQVEDAGALAAASEACLCGGEIEAQIARRRSRLGEVAGPRDANLADLARFLASEFDPACNTLLAQARHGYARQRFDFAGDIGRDKISLCPSDFGFHNILRSASGLHCFIDFEYLGWDDPVKLTADLLLHPGTEVAPPLKRRLASGCRRIYGGDPTFHARLELLYPLFGLRWCLILLNEFLPERWAHRLHADEARAWAIMARRQLERARSLCAELRALQGRFPHVE